VGRWGHTLSRTPAGCLLFGGYNRPSYLGDVWVSGDHDAAGGSSVQALGLSGVRGPSDVPAGRSNHVAVSLGGFVYLHGGSLSRSERTSDVFALLPAPEAGVARCARVAVTAGGAEPCPRTFHAAAALDAGPTFVIFGGEGAADSPRGGGLGGAISPSTGQPLAARSFDVGAGGTAGGAGAPASSPASPGQQQGSGAADLADLWLCTVRGSSSGPSCSWAQLGPTHRAAAAAQGVGGTGEVWPTARRCHAMATDPATQAVVLLGGCTGADFRPLADLWVLRLLGDSPDACAPHWMTPAVGGTPPEARWGHTLTAVARSAEQATFICVGGRGVQRDFGDLHVLGLMWVGPYAPQAVWTTPAVLPAPSRPLEVAPPNCPRTAHH
jgi:hypothetical protein